MKIQENSSLRSISELEEVVMEEDLLFGRIERKEKKREKMKRKSEGRREKWLATLVGPTLFCFPIFLSFD